MNPKTEFDRRGLFSRSFRGSDAKNLGYHQPIEMKLCISHYSQESITDAKFYFGTFSIFGDMASQNFTLKRRKVMEFGCLSPEKMGLILK